MMECRLNEVCLSTPAVPIPSELTLFSPQAPGNCWKIPRKGRARGKRACAEAGLLQEMCKELFRAAAKGARVGNIRGTKLMPRPEMNKKKIRETLRAEARTQEGQEHTHWWP